MIGALLADAPVRLRDAADADMAAIQAIYAHHVTTGLGTFEETPPDEAELAGRRRRLVAPGLPYLVAEEGGGIAGFAYAAPYRTRTAYRHTVEDSVYVAPSAMRRGVGRALLAALIQRCATSGYSQMVAVIGDSGNEASIRLHAGLGFREAGVLRAVGFKFGRWTDTVLMQRPLGPGDASPET